MTPAIKENIIRRKGSYIYDVHTEGGGWEGGSLGICHVFAHSIVFKQ